MRTAGNDDGLTLDVHRRAYFFAVRVGLRAGDEVRCPRCRRWHPVEKLHTSGTDYTLKMLYFECGGQRFYAGQEGLESRHETRVAAK